MKAIAHEYEKALAWIKGKSEQFVEELGNLVSYNSISEYEEGVLLPFGGACADALNCALKYAADKGLETENHEYYIGSVILKGNGGSQNEIGMIGHLDVVPDGEGWKYEPYKMTVEGDLLVGRGVSDDKGPTLAGIYAMYYLVENGYTLNHDIRCLLGCNEEAGMQDVKYYNSHFTPPAFVFSPDCNFPVCNSEKGMMIWDMTAEIAESNLRDFHSGIAHNVVPNKATAVLEEITLQQAKKALYAIGSDVEARPWGGYGNMVEFEAIGIGAHAAMPENSLNAAWKLADALLKSGLADDKASRTLRFIYDHFSDFYGQPFGIDCEDEASGKLTHIGGMTWVEDGKLTQNMNIRYPMSADTKVLSESIEAECGKYGFSAKMTVMNEGLFIPADAPEIECLQKVCRETIGIEAPPYSMGGGTYSRKFPRAVGFGPFMPGGESPFGPERGGAHQPDECQSLDMLLKAAAVYAVALISLDEIVD